MRRKIKYSQELADKICSHIVECRSLAWIEAQKDMPSKRTILRWAAQNEDFREHYIRAKEFQADAFAEEILAIADDGRNDTYFDEESGRQLTDHENIQRSRLRIDARKWLMSKMLPKKYGNHTQLEHSGSVGQPATVQVIQVPEQAASTEEWMRMHAPQGAVESGSQN